MRWDGGMKALKYNVGKTGQVCVNRVCRIKENEEGSLTITLVLGLQSTGEILEPYISFVRGYKPLSYVKEVNASFTEDLVDKIVKGQKQSYICLNNIAHICKAKVVIKDGVITDERIGFYIPIGHENGYLNIVKVPEKDIYEAQLSKLKEKVREYIENTYSY